MARSRPKPGRRRFAVGEDLNNAFIDRMQAARSSPPPPG